LQVYYDINFTKIRNFFVNDTDINIKRYKKAPKYDDASGLLLYVYNRFKNYI